MKPYILLLTALLFFLPAAHAQHKHGEGRLDVSIDRDLITLIIILTAISAIVGIFLAITRTIVSSPRRVNYFHFLIFIRQSAD